VKVIYRTDPTDKGEPIAFFPEASANPGMIVCYAHIGQHSEACNEYYRSCKPIRGPLTGAAASLHHELSQSYAPEALQIRQRR
jgi:hypothetical protein